MSKFFPDYRKYKFITDLERRDYPCGCWGKEVDTVCKNKSSLHYFNPESVDPENSYGVVICSLTCLQKYVTPVLNPQYQEDGNDEQIESEQEAR